MEEIRDLDHRLVCHADGEKGLIEYRYGKNLIIRIHFLPEGGTVEFIRGGQVTRIRRTGSGKLQVYSGYHYGLPGQGK